MKRLPLVVSLVVLLCFAFACQNKAEKAELEKFRAQAKLEEQNEAFYRRIIEEVNKGNLDILKESFAPEYNFYSPSISTKPISREEANEFTQMILRAFPDFNFGIKDLTAVGDKVIVNFIYTGTHKGEFQGIPATGNKVEYSAFVVAKIKNGKIIEEREEFDSIGLMQQLGMELKPKEAENK